ncbi:MAG: acyl-CoA dehydrogenase C-terminal domain-containing protein [Aestuariivita sp.]|nr:acyl-CoA dehydrogenase C-terminal domain-containing protein [Aestuariivita sp.]
MPSYHPPIQDVQFLLHDVLKISEHDIPGYDDLSQSFTEAILTEAGKLGSEVLNPLNASGDREGCTLLDGHVTTPVGFKEAFAQLRLGGWTGLDMPVEYGGQGLPCIVHTAVGEIFSASNQAFSMYHALTHGAASAILTHGTQKQKETYLPQMITCEWTGTMNLTEPQCGTDLGLIRTKAEPESDDYYRITGQKIFISAGEHDLADNIIHLVLARIVDAPKGIKGISLFIVPKFLVNEDGSLGRRNSVQCSKIEDKMGIHGNATCVMNYDGAVGYLVGKPNQGMRAMFTMMNEARLGVGLQGLAQADVAYQNALEYAKERLQGRDVMGTKSSEDSADPLIVHPDIRRSLMDQKSFTEGARALVLWSAMLIDRGHRKDDQPTIQLISLLTPVIKGFLTDQGYEMTIQAQQIYGGHGYIEEYGMSQFTRDARIAMIYEGANGIQALDLVGRKLLEEGFETIERFIRSVSKYIIRHRNGSEFTQHFFDVLQSSTTHLQLAVNELKEKSQANPNFALAGSYDFMHLLGHICLGYMWTKIALVAKEKRDSTQIDHRFLNAKINTALYYMERRLPATEMHLRRIKSGDKRITALDPRDF